MVRKSERNKAQGTPEKLIPERTRKSTRQSSRRKKKSSSESEGEPDVLVDKDKKEVGELSESKPQTDPASTEVKEDGARTRRSVRRQPNALSSDKEQEPEKSSEWKEDPSFWHSEGPAPLQAETSGEPKLPADDGITWKIQSSNGSGGEIQKLKICRQRVAESSESSSPTKEASPRRKRYTRSSKNLEALSENTESGSEVSHETKDEHVNSQETVIPGPENVEDVNKAEEMTTNEPDKDIENDKSTLENDIGSSAIEDSTVNSSSFIENKSSEVKIANSPEEAMTDPNKEENENHVMQPKEDSTEKKTEENEPHRQTEVVETVEHTEENETLEQAEVNETLEQTVVNETQKQTEQFETLEQTVLNDILDQTEENETREQTEVNEIQEPGEENKIEEQTDDNKIQEQADEKESQEQAEEKETEEHTDEKEPKEHPEETETTEQTEENETQEHMDENKKVMSCIGSSAEEAPVNNIENPMETVDSQDLETSHQKLDDDVSAEESNRDIDGSSALNKEEDSTQLVSDSHPDKEPKSRTESENSEDGKNEKDVPSQVNSVDDTNKEEILKKLNERAVKFPKEPNDGKKKEESVHADPRSPREEGELTPVLETKKSKHTTIIINRPKEVTSQPTKLKRNTDDFPSPERKRRLISKPKPKEKEEDPFNISSESLMLLVPEVKTITPEQVASFPLDDEDLSKFELDQPSDMSNKKKINLKAKDVEVRVQNDSRQVSKKKQIVIEMTNEIDESKAVGPKLPLQENHRVVRKISLLSDDIKKVRRSPSPSGKAATEVLFITNLVRPFTVPQLRELLARTGTIASNGFYIDKIKSKCYVKYTDVEMAVETRHALNGVRWPVNNPKTLKVEFATAEDMAAVQKLADEETAAKKPETAEPVAAAGWLSEQAALKPQRRVTTAVREWDMGKVGTGATEEKRQVEEWQAKTEPTEVKRRAASPVETKFEAPARKIKKRDNDAPARLLDDLFRKTKATPCIYWLPLTAAQIAVKEEMRRQHMAEHERRLAELRKNDHTRRDKDREKSRDSRRKK